MSFSPIKPGGWAFGELLTSAHMNALDADHANAIDGLNGGSYELQNDLNIDGAVGAELHLVISTIIHSLASFVNGFAVDGLAQFNGNAEFNNPVEFTNTLLAQALATFEAGAEFNDTATFNDAAVFHQLVTLLSTLNADGNCFLGNPGFIELLGTVTARKPISFADDGKLLERTQVIAVAGNQTIVAAHVDLVWIPNGVMANLNTLTIDDTGAQDGMSVCFSTRDTSNTIIARTPGAAQSVALKKQANANADCRFTRIDGTWEITSLPTGQS